MTSSELISFDVETHLIQPGLLAPPLVCGSVASPRQSGQILDKERTLALFRQIVESADILVGANIAYDLLVCAVEWARRGVDLMPAIFGKYDRSEVFDVQIAEALHALARGHLGASPDGRPLTDAKGRPTTRYSLDTVCKLVLQRDTAKVNDEWRLRYAELESIPIEEWPLTARTYPIDDAVHTLDCAVQQLREHENLHDLPRQVYAAWSLHLGAAWGPRVDGPSVDALETRVLESRAENLTQFIEAGFFKLGRDGKPVITEKGAESKNQSVLKRQTAAAYGCTGQCLACSATGKVPGAGKAKKNCPTCDGTGLELDTGSVPLTEKGAVQIGRDSLFESGDETLMAFASFSEEDKIRTTYIPFLRKGVDAPLNLRPNVLLETGRVSYSDPIQQLPREGGVRECIIPRPGHVFCSCDYSGLELATHAQSCLWLLGYSRLAEALNGGLDAHASFAASMLGIPVDQFDKKDSEHKKYRQAAKAANFGFPGGMGAPKLVLAQRKGGPDTVGPDGTHYKGLRFCVLIGGEPQCGTVKVTEWKDRQLTPTCKRCIQCAEDLRRAWFAQWPESRDYFKLVSDQVDRHGYIVQHVSERKRGGVTFTSAANGYFQSLAADGAKEALCRVAKEQYCDRSSPLYGTRTILFAHDELLVEMSESRSHEAAIRLSEVMVAAMREYTPDVRIAAEPALMRRWYKGAEPVYSEGRLIPWEPSA